MSQKLMHLLLLIFIQLQMFCVQCTDPRIVGGEECDYSQYPYAVAIFSTQACGGSLISLEWILTAAHCVSLEQVSKRQVYLRTGFNHKNLVQVRRAIRGIQHDDYQDNRDAHGRYDIGLLLADRPFEQTPHLKPAKLPDPGFASKCETVTAIGIGVTKKLGWHENPPPITRVDGPLRCIELPLISQETCSWQWGTYLGDSLLCTWDRKGEKGTCFGDSGSPIVCQEVVIAVHNGGLGCAQSRPPNIHTKVEYFLDFISKNTNIKVAGGRSLNGSNMIAPRKSFLILAFSLRYVMVNGFGH